MLEIGFGEADMHPKFKTWSRLRSTSLAAIVVVILGQHSIIWGQDQPTSAKPANADGPIVIPDEPKTIDPATFMPPHYAASVTVVFDGSPLKAVFNWLKDDQKINVIVDYRSLAKAKVLDTDPVFEQLKDAPLYLLLNRLEAQGLGWYVDDNTLWITSLEESRKHTSTVPYNLGDLFDAGYSSKDLLRTIRRCSGSPWEGEDTGSMLLLGDVVFIRQTDKFQREIRGLLQAIRKHGRRTMTLDSPRNATLRAVLDKSVTVDFQETPLITALKEISEQVGIEVRLDRAALNRDKDSVRERTPVTLKLADQKLTAVLRSLLSSFNLSWFFRDEVLWLTTKDAAQLVNKTAVFDVRDLCSDYSESTALMSAIELQTRVFWSPSHSDQGRCMEMPIPGVLVVRHTEAVLNDITQLLENYRTALRVSKVRTVPSGGLDPNEVITGFYRLPAPMAKDLDERLPELILPETWHSVQRPTAIGTSEQIPLDTKGDKGPENVVLMVRQTRAAHQQIGKLIDALMKSNAVDSNATADTSKKREAKTGTFGSRLIPAAAK